MPARSKQTKVEWTSCKICGCKFSQKDAPLHQEMCSVGNAFNVEQSSLTDLKHGFSFGRSLAAPISVINSLPEHVPKEQEHSLVFLHPSAMQLCGLHIGKPVVIDNQHVFMAWPNPGSPLASAGFTQFSLENILHKTCTQAVCAYAPNNPIGIATEVTVYTGQKKNFLASSEFLEFLSIYFNGRYFTRGSEWKFSYYGQPCQFTVVRIASSASCVEETSVDSLVKEVQEMDIKEETSLMQPDSSKVKRFYSANTSTHISIKDNSNHKIDDSKKIFKVGGLEKQRRMINEMIDLHLHKSEAMNIHGLDTPRGILLYGPSGTGKTLLAKSIRGQSGVHFIEIQGAEIWSRFYGESEARLTKIFREAKEKAPSIVFIDEIDALCPKRTTSNNEVEKRVVASLLTLMDDVLGSQPPVFFIAATNKRDQLDPSLRRPGRLDREVEIGVPSASERVLILRQLLESTTHDVLEKDVQSAAEKAHGFVGADLAAVCKEAGIRALKRQESSPCLNYEDLLHGLNSVQPSAMREVAIEIPDVTWADIGGQEDLKQKLRQAIEWPLKHPEAFLRLGIRPPRGLLMYGPPGCSKTMIAKALARESGINFIAIKGPELFSKWVGESERAVREVFRKARSAAPAIVFFDEIDALAGERGSSGGGGDVSDRVLAQLLTEIDGVESLKDVTIVAATNRPDRIDKALLRPGRLDRIVYVSLPDDATRKQIFQIRFRKTPTAEDVQVDSLVQRTHGYSGAEVAAVCQEAALHALQEDMELCHVSARHFDLALETVKPRITGELISFYNTYAQSSGLHSI